jgi:RNA polymerase sigma-70 factor (ECF subfamily)
MEASIRERNNREWLSDLRAAGDQQEAALQDLRAIIMRGLPYALSKWLPTSDAQFDSFVEEVSQNTLLRVLDQIDSFEGRSKFTTWVHKIAVNIALAELRRKRWQDVSLEDLIEGANGGGARGLMIDPAMDPEMAAEQADMITRVGRIMQEELTEKQRTVLVAARIHDMPVDEIARRLDTNRNALYKLIHDARLRLKDRLAQEGLSPEDVLAAFEAGSAGNAVKHG